MAKVGTILALEGDNGMAHARPYTIIKAEDLGETLVGGLVRNSLGGDDAQG